MGTRYIEIRIVYLFNFLDLTIILLWLNSGVDDRYLKVLSKKLGAGVNFTFLLFHLFLLPPPPPWTFSPLAILSCYHKLLCLIQKKDFPGEQFFVVFVIKPEDYACGGSFFIQGKR